MTKKIAQSIHDAKHTATLTESELYCLALELMSSCTIVCEDNRAVPIGSPQSYPFIGLVANDKFEIDSLPANFTTILPNG